MTSERLHLHVSRPLLDMFRHNETIAGLVKLFRSILHASPPDTEIAWEDGEAGEKPVTRR
jgi:hypothetical protein